MSVADVRAAEAVAMRSVSEPVLMARAADAVASECDTVLASTRGRVVGAHVAVVAGTGKNGGDGLLAGARLAARGVRVTAVLVAGYSDAAAVQESEEAGCAVVDATESPAAALHAVASADLVVDAIVGLGSAPGLRRPADALIAAIPTSTPVVAVDLPSGLDADSSAADQPHVKATVTVTFTALKECLAHEPARVSAGRIVVAQVGIPTPNAR